MKQPKICSCGKYRVERKWINGQQVCEGCYGEKYRENRSIKNKEAKEEYMLREEEYTMKNMTKL